MITIMQQLAAACSTLPKDASALDASISACRSSISALDNSIKDLEGSSSWPERIAIVCAIVVGIGVIGELVVIVSEHRGDIRDWLDSILCLVRLSDRPPRWRFVFDVVTTLLVGLGVLGEAGASMRLAFINSQLRSRTSELRGDSDQLLALVTQEAGSAAKSAHDAALDARNAKADAGEAKETANDAIGAARKASEEIAGLDTGLSEAKKRAEELRKALLPRSFNQSAVADALRPFGPHEAIIETISDFECRRTAELIGSSLTMANWNVSLKVRFDTGTIDDFFFSGIEIHGNCVAPVFEGTNAQYEEEKGCGKLEDALPEALTSSGLPDAHKSWPGSSIPFNSFLIRVGMRRIPGENTNGVLFTPNGVTIGP